MKPKSVFFRSSLFAAGLVTAISLNSCTQYQQQGAVLGGLGGAALGAVAGDDSGDVLQGAALGAAVGTGAAALKENNDRNRGYYNSGGDQARNTAPPTPTPPASNKKFPKATPTDNPNLVVSPFPPHNVIDVRGFQSGQLAKDPSNNEIFLIP